jgi:(p)ppGpp synthase/HD superfamily hydrolase
VQHLDHAIQIALEAHDGQEDKVDRPYFEHSQRVALLVSGDEARDALNVGPVIDDEIAVGRIDFGRLAA